jgi:hypothetical protein
MTLKIEIFASNGDQVKLKYFVYFPWPPIEAGLAI